MNRDRGGASSYRVEFRPYCRRFEPALKTNHGVWCDRTGIIIKLTDEQGRVGFGEIAPLKEFGSESIEAALQFCVDLHGTISRQEIFLISATLPACQFAFESAQETLTHSQPPLAKRPAGTPNPQSPIPNPQSPIPNPQLPIAKLLPTRADALHLWKSHWEKGDRTFKLKIGVAPIAEELEFFRQLKQVLPAEACLRLDANGGLNKSEALQWLACCDDWLNPVEFLEQPLSPDQFATLLELSQQFVTPIALDESVATLDQLEACHQQGWRGIVVVKAAIAGSPHLLRQMIRQYKLEVVWSSVFETTIAQGYILNHLIPSVSQNDRAIGFGVNHWFSDHFNHLDREQLWQSLGMR